MQRIALTGGDVILPDRILEQASIVCREDCIEQVAPASEVDTGDCVVLDATDCYVSPGFVDLHIHGGAGADFMDGEPQAARKVAETHLRHGTTTLFPTTTTGSTAQILDMIAACQSAAADIELPNIPGIHLYGPYFAKDKVGCHSLAGCRPPEPSEYEQYFQTDFVRIATCAAELPAAEGFYETAAKHNCLITCGHSNASWPEMKLAFDRGMRHVDHFWCAMSSVPSLRQRFGVPMQASMAEFVLMHPEMSTEVIADGCHLSAELLEFAYRMLGPDRLCLVTDCNRGLDLPPGNYRFGNALDGSWFKSDGHVGWAPDGKSLASSIMGMDHMVRHMRHSTSAELSDVIRMASLTPARRTGIDQQVGSIAVGKQADLLVLDRDLSIKNIVLRGRVTANS